MSQESQHTHAFSAATLLDYHASDGDGVLDERRFAPLPRAGITNLGNTCFLSSSIQLLARPLIATRSASAAGTLAARAADVALHAVLGVQCSTAALQELLTTLPCGFGWRASSGSKAVLSVQEDAHEFVMRLLGSSAAASTALASLIETVCICATCGESNEQHNDET